MKNRQLRLKLFLVFFSLLGSIISFSQKMVITGTVYDSSGVNQLCNATITAVRLRDSLLLGYTHTNSRGNFALEGFEIDTFSLTIQHPNSEMRRYFIFGSKQNYKVDIPFISLSTKTKEIEEIVIYIYKNPIYYRGDTLVYVADSFQLGLNARVEDLFKKLPGVKIESNGVITAQGEQIGRVLVDGDEFFGSDNSIATQNLEAKAVDKVEVYEKQIESHKIKVIDIKLKKDFKNGYFGRISAAADPFLTSLNSSINNNFLYQGELLLNYFNEKQKISVFALTSNTPVSNFGWGEMNKFGLQNEDGASRNYWEVSTKSNDGIPRTFKAGFYYTDKIGKKGNGKIVSNYSYINSDLKINSAKFTEYFLSDSLFFISDSSLRTRLIDNHKVNLLFECPVGKFITIKTNPSISIGSTSLSGLDLSIFQGINYQKSLETVLSNSNKKITKDFQNFSSISLKFNKKNRLLEAKHLINWQWYEGNGFLFLNSINFSNPDLTEVLNQRIDQLTKSTGNSFEISFTEPITKYFSVTGSYNIDKMTRKLNRSSFDYNGVSFDSENLYFSTNLNNEIISNYLSFGSKINKGKHEFRCGTKLRLIEIYNFDKVSILSFNKKTTTFLPHIFYQYKTSITNKFSVDFNTDIFIPSQYEYVPIMDNSNPNVLKGGNIRLIPSYIHTLKFNQGNWKTVSGVYMSTTLILSYLNNAVNDSVSYDSFGRTRSSLVNIDGNIFSNFRYGIGIPIINKKAEVTTSVNLSANRFKGYIDNKLNITDDFRGGGAVGFNLNMDSIEFYVRFSVDISNPRSTLNKLSRTNLITQLHDIGFVWRLPCNFNIKTDVTWRSFSQSGNDFFYDIFICDISLGKNFLKTENLFIEIIGNDIFNQNVNLDRNIYQNAIVYNRINLITRYFMLKSTFRFNHNKTKENDHNKIF